MSDEIARLVAGAKDWSETADAEWRLEATLVRRTGWPHPSTDWPQIVERAVEAINRARPYSIMAADPKDDPNRVVMLKPGEMVIRGSEVAGAAAEIYRLRAELAQMKAENLEYRARMLEDAGPPTILVPLPETRR